MRARLRLKKHLRIRRRLDFQRVRLKGRTTRNPVLRINWFRRDEGATRLGLAVPRRVGSAVARNRIKRVLREAFRKDRSLYPAGLDLVVTPVNAFRARSLDEVRRSLLELTERMGRDEDAR